MARARSKQELLDFSEKEYATLMEYVVQYETEGYLEEPIFDNRTVKDILAHLYAWYELFYTWYDEGMNDGEPEIPAPGYTFKTTPDLNEKLYQDYKDVGWKEIKSDLDDAHKKCLKIIESHSEEELFTKKLYKWTGSTSMGSYLASCTSSHYAWANKLLKKKLKNS
jgi:hypothetical protein